MRLTAVLRRGSSLVLAVATGGGTAPVTSHHSIMPENLSENSSAQNVLSAHCKCRAVPCTLPYLPVSIHLVVNPPFLFSVAKCISLLKSAYLMMQLWLLIVCFQCVCFFMSKFSLEIRI